MEEDFHSIREAVWSGSFYPDDPSTLSRQVTNFLNKVPWKEKSEESVIGLIVPHAGYVYSGQVAAYAYRRIEGLPIKSVIIIAPSHRAYFKGVSLYPKGAYRTPLGLVPINSELGLRIKKETEVIESLPKVHQQEHSLEVQLPFLQTLLPGFDLVPLLMGDQGIETCLALSQAISAVIMEEDKVLVVASSDLSHFHPYEMAQRMDMRVAEHIKSFQPLALARDLKEGAIEACGGGPIITSLLIGEKLGASGTKVLKYLNSGDVTGEKREVVGYLSAILYKKKKGEGLRR